MPEEYAHRNGLLKPMHFTDDGVSGTRIERPGFTAMMEEVNAGRVEVYRYQGYEPFRARLPQGRADHENFAEERHPAYRHQRRRGQKESNQGHLRLGFLHDCPHP